VPLSYARGLGRLARLRLSPFTMSVPVLGAASAVPMASGGRVLLLLLLVGLSAHVFGFVLNDLLDLDIDQAEGRRTPLTVGSVSVRSAVGLCTLQLPVLALAYLIGLSGGAIGALLAAAALALSAGYNLWSKRGHVPPLLAEVALGASISTLALSGSFAVSESPPAASYYLAVALGLVVHQLNSVPSGLKDLVSDHLYGVRSFVIAAGCRVSDGGQVAIPGWLRRYAELLLAAVLLLTLLLAQAVNAATGVVIVAGTFVGVAFGYNESLLTSRRTEELKRFPPRAMYFAYFGVTLVLIGSLPTPIQLLLGACAAYYLVLAVHLAVQTMRRSHSGLDP
jgi:4-hydroxybenzoate polyprenyltransferase